MGLGNESKTGGFHGTRSTESLDELFDALKNSRRRAVLRYVLQEEDNADFKDLVEYVAARENDTDPREVSPEQRNRVRTALYQHHLGKLENAGFIDYDKRQGTVHLNGNTEAIERYIEGTEPARTPTIEYAAGLLIIGVAIGLLLMPAWSSYVAVAMTVIGLLLVFTASQRSGR